jgi:tetratricopeptide (TPR) repeat protein
VALAVLVAASLFVFANPATAQSSPVAELDRVLDEVQAEKTTTVALAKVKAVARLSSWVPRPTYAQKIAATAKSVDDPLVKFALLRQAAWTYREIRDDRWGADGMKGPLGDQACLRSWQIVGPFDNPSMEGFTRTFGPEFAEVGPYDGKLAEIDWRELPQHDDYCEFNLGRSVQPTTAAVTYLATSVETKSAQNAVLLMGTDGAYKVWLNGKLVGERDEDTGMFLDDDAWKVRLQKGKNDLLVKLASTQDGGLGVVARLVDRNLKPLQFEQSATWSRRRVEKAEPNPDDRGVTAQIEANAERLKGDAAVWNAWLWRSAAWQNVAVPWRDVADRLIENVDALTPRRQALLAELYEEHWRRLDILEAAHKRSPGDPWVTTALADELERAIAAPEKLRTRRLLEQIAEKKPEYIVAPIYLSDWYKRHGFAERALEVLEAMELENGMQISAFAIRYVGLHRDVGDLPRSLELERQAWKWSYMSSGYVWNEVKRLAHQRKWKEALKTLDDYLEVLPRSEYARLEKAEIFRAQGRDDEALALYDALIADSPGDADLWEKKARLQLALDRQEDAVATLEEALQHRPQDQDMRDLLAFLRPRENRFYEPWMEEDPREIAESFAPSPFNYDTIIDNAVTYVSQNGLASTVYQRVDRVLKPQGIDAVKRHRASYQMGDEDVEVLSVRVLEPDGGVSEDYEKWDSGGTRKGSTTYNDTAYVTMQANDVEVGDLVEFRYRVSQVANENFRGDYFGDIAYLQGGRPIALQRWAVVYPRDLQLYFREPKLEHEKIEDADPSGGTPPEGFRSTSFELRDVPHVETDPRQPGYTDVYDYLLVSNKKTYDEVGKWWWNLVKEQLIVDENIRSKVDELTEGLETEDEKIRAIHNYVVKNTRYLHVGLGIHGWKPYRTTTCFRNRFGDCKDKASLLKVMLEEAGVKANLVLVRTRRLGTVGEFPASMHVFNHAITYVPSKDLFLDGTAEFNGTRELTTMDQGAQALIVEDGGEARMVTLPIDEPDQNLLRTVMEVDLTGEEPVARGTMEAHGANAVYFRQSLEDPERRDEVLEEQLADEFPGARLVSAKYDDLSNLEKPTKVEFTFEGGQLLRDDGRRKFVLPVGRQKNLLDAYAKQAKRDQDLSIRVPFANETQIRYRLGGTKTIEEMPRGTEKKSKFGSLKIDYQKDGEDLIVDVRYSIDTQRVAVEDYPEFRKFMADVNAALNDSIAIGSAE